MVIWIRDIYYYSALRFEFCSRLARIENTRWGLIIIFCVHPSRTMRKTRSPSFESSSKKVVAKKMNVPLKRRFLWTEFRPSLFRISARDIGKAFLFCFVYNERTLTPLVAFTRILVWSIGAINLTITDATPRYASAVVTRKGVRGAFPSLALAFIRPIVALWFSVAHEFAAHTTTVRDALPRQTRSEVNQTTPKTTASSAPEKISI